MNVQIKTDRSALSKTLKAFTVKHSLNVVLFYLSTLRLPTHSDYQTDRWSEHRRRLTTTDMDWTFKTSQQVYAKYCSHHDFPHNYALSF